MPEVRQKLLDAIDTGAAFRTVVRDLGLTSQQVWGLTRTDQEWLEQREAALTASRRDDLQHGTNAAYVHGCACRDCREHQQKRIGAGSAPRTNGAGYVSKSDRPHADRPSLYSPLAPSFFASRGSVMPQTLHHGCSGLDRACEVRGCKPQLWMITGSLTGECICDTELE